MATTTGRRITAALALATLSCGAMAAFGTTASQAAETKTVAWGACPTQAEGEPARDGRQQCATVKVPLNYDDADGTKIDVSISRISTAKPGKRRGVLVLNPGGPALAGLDLPGQIAPTLPTSVLESYDLVGFDPRGVGHSTPQSCGLADPNLTSMFPYPAADGSITKNVELARSVAAKCASSASGKNLKYFTTANTARDLDQVRKALGEKKISYWGQSYGTYLGAVYASLFAGHTDRVILEGNVDPTKVWAEQYSLWGKGMQDRFADLAPGAAKTYLALVDRLDRKPAKVPGTQIAVTGAIVRSLTYGLLLHNETLPLVPQVWVAAQHLADGALTAADAKVLQQVSAPQPAAPGVPADNQATMALALTCGDAEWSDDVDEYAAKTAADRKAFPLTGGMPANVWPCAFWKDSPIEDPIEVTDDGPRNVLILQNRRDNATPWEGGLGLKKALGQRAQFVGVDNGGHYVYNAGSKCADRATVDFLTTGRLSSDRVDCTDVP
ncbi:alpha/beta hydrolase [Cryptosporangium sp. NPDC048952]|uniref:alpha/beta hydrolase n=1 Tax=Cryptosporangium sp. NPDC048952 TaxID=3363961 RepID=UPI003722ECEE